MGRLGFLGLLVIAMAGLSACGGGRSEQSTEVRTTTTGQELTDLKKALDEGAISQSEYDKKRKDILKNG